MNLTSVAFYCRCFASRALFMDLIDKDPYYVDVINRMAMNMSCLRNMALVYTVWQLTNTEKHKQNCRHFAGNIFKGIFDKCLNYRFQFHPILFQ